MPAASFRNRGTAAASRAAKNVFEPRPENLKLISSMPNTIGFQPANATTLRSAIGREHTLRVCRCPLRLALACFQTGFPPATVDKSVSLRPGRYAWEANFQMFLGFVIDAAGGRGYGPAAKSAKIMRLLLLLVLWCLLFVACWPLAILALLLFPVVWLISLPLRLVGITVGAAFALLRAVLFLPVRVLGLALGRRG